MNNSISKKVEEILSKMSLKDKIGQLSLGTFSFKKIDEAKEYIKNNEFAKGSMLPKVEACMDFVESSKNGIAIISALKDGIRALNNETGTRIVK